MSVLPCEDEERVVRRTRAGGGGDPVREEIERAGEEVGRRRVMKRVDPCG